MFIYYKQPARENDFAKAQKRHEVGNGGKEAVAETAHAGREEVKLGVVEQRLKAGIRAKTEVAIAGIKIPDPEQAYKDLQKALSRLSKYFHIDRNDVYFRNFPGQIVAESTTKGSGIDPILLMHPVNRVARIEHTLGHEESHQKNTIQNEGLVEAHVRAIGFIEGEEPALRVTEKYETALSNFHEFVSRVQKGKDANSMVKEIYKLYYEGKYEDIYEMYNERYVNALPEDKKDEAVEFFWMVFPELEYNEKGLVEPIPVEPKKTSEKKKGGKPVDVVSTARAGVERRKKDFEK